MPEKACLNCKALHDCRDNASSWFFLFIGLIATIAVRLVNVVMDFGPFWAKLSWYVGISGFLVYFLYKYRQHKAMRMFLLNSGIAEKIRKNDPLTKTESEFVSSLFCSLRSRKDSINYFFIFFTSALALLLGAYQDFFKN
ncbi:MAG: hypothetical protein JW788_01180 [Candidatus Omnitrophica bacterium]|nr:hypothetical protein [Candidatus Omnitrophota bacterium]